jgi:hypothetical protein
MSEKTEKTRETTVSTEGIPDPMAAYANLSPEQKAEHERQIEEQRQREQTTTTPPLPTQPEPEATPKTTTKS